MSKSKLMILVAFLLAGVTACSDGGKKKQGNEGAQSVRRDLKFESYTFDFVAEFPSADSVPAPGGKYVRLVGQGVLPQDIGEQDIRILRDSLMSIAGMEYAGPDSPVPVMRDSLSLTELDASRVEACGNVYSNLSLSLLTPRVVVWECFKSSYACMAAHGNSSTSYLNYSLSDGRILKLSDLMVPDYEAQLREIIAEKLESMDVQLLIDPSEVKVSPEFGITPGGIVFSYDPYEIAPYSEGTVQVELSAGDMYDILSEKGIYIIVGQTPV